MDNSSSNGTSSLILSIILGIFTWFTPDRVDIVLKIITASGALVSAIMATRYYYTAAKLNKERIKRLKDKR